MSIGFGIFLIAVGAILVWALNVSLDWLDLDLVGYIFIGAGIVITIIGITLLVRRRQASSTTRTSVDPVNGERVTRSESTSDDL